MGNKTICFFNSVDFWGGGEKLHLEYALEFKKRNYIVWIVAKENSPLSKTAKEEGLNVFNISVGNISFLNFLKYIKLANFYKKENINTVVFSTSQDLKLGGFSARLINMNKIVYLRGLAVNIKNSFINRLLFRNVLTHIIPNSEATKKAILKNLYKSIDKSKLKIVYHGIEIKNSTEKLDLVTQQANGIILGNAGRLTEQKGQKYLIELAKLLKKQELKFTLFIAGTGDLTETLKELIQEYNLEKEVILLGFVKDIDSFMNSLDIFILSSIWEGFGYVIAEAMAFKKPVIAFDISSNPELINNGRTGYLTEFGNIKAMANKVIELSTDEVLRQEMGESGFERVKNEFTLDKAYENLIYALEG